MAVELHKGRTNEAEDEPVLAATDCASLQDALREACKSVLKRSLLGLWAFVQDLAEDERLVPLGKPFPAGSGCPVTPREAGLWASALDGPVILPRQEFIDRSERMGAGRRTFRAPGIVLFPFFREDRAVALALLTVGQAALKRGSEVLRELQEKLAHMPCAVEKILLRKRSIAELREISAVARTSATLLSIKGQDKVLQEIVDVLIGDLRFDRATVGLLSEDGRKLTFAASHGFPVSQFSQPLPLKRRGVLARALRKDKVLVVTPSDESDYPAALKPSARNALATIIPLKLKDESFGLIVADHLPRPGRPVSRHSAAIEIFANEAAVALENAKLYAQVERLAETDALTGIFNRYYFERALKREIPRVKRLLQPLCLLMIDICDFKRTNDTYGHLLGDKILKTVARLLKDHVREMDIVARFGGDEFVVLMPDTGEAQARLVQKRIEEAVKSHNGRATEEKDRFLLSIGLKCATALNVDQILGEADRAMYHSRDMHFRKHLLDALGNDDLHRLEKVNAGVSSVLRLLREKENFYLPHARRVMKHAVKIAKGFRLNEDEAETIALAAVLHDVGKAAIHPDILNSPSPLSPQEFDIVKTHPTLGADLLDGIPALKEVQTVVRAHHLRVDGKTTGPFPSYPENLRGAQIPLGARILKVADAFDAMTSWRPYRKPVSAKSALSVLVKDSGRAFDRAVVDIFKQRVEIKAGDDEF